MIATHLILRPLQLIKRERERVRGGLAESVNEGGGLEKEEERERDS
jgi:hypothetical protein